VRVAVAVGADGAALTCELMDDGTSHANPAIHKELLTAVTAAELAGPVRWVWASTARVYPELLRAGRRWTGVMIWS
jgi:DNA polymerase-1